MNLNRLGKYLSDYERFNITPKTSVDVVSQVGQLLCFVGPFSWTRKNLIDLGRILICSERPKIYIPLCLIGGVGFDFMPVVRSHIKLLQNLPFEFEVMFLLPGQIDTALSQTVRIFLAEQGYQVEFLYSFFSELPQLEHFHSERLRSSDFEKQRLDLDVGLRSSLYERMGVYSYKDRFDRALKTAVEHLAFAQVIKEVDGIVMMHTTTNLRHYRDTRVPVLHNEITLI